MSVLHTAISTSSASVFKPMLCLTLLPITYSLFATASSKRPVSSVNSAMPVSVVGSNHPYISYASHHPTTPTSSSVSTVLGTSLPSLISRHLP